MTDKRKTEYISIRLSSEQKRRLQSRAEHDSKSLSAYILDCTLGSDRYEPYKQILCELADIRTLLSSRENPENQSMLDEVNSELQKIYSEFIRCISLT